MNRLLISALLAILLHGLLFLIWDCQVPERTGTKTGESKGILVRLEAGLYQQMDHISQQVHASHELIVSEESESRDEKPGKTSEPDELSHFRKEKDIKQDPDGNPQETKPEKPEPEIIKTEYMPGLEGSSGLSEQLTALEEVPSRDLDYIKDYVPESRVEKQDKEKRELESKANSASAATSLEKVDQSHAAQELSRSIDDLKASDAGIQTEREDPVKLARPLYRENPPPRYPLQARKRHYQGTVVLDVLVDTRGEAQDVRIVESSGYSILDRAAREAVEGWRFEPGRRNDRPEDTWVKLPVRFELK